MPSFLVEIIDWLAGEGSVVLAALIIGLFGVAALWIWKTVGPKIEEARLKAEIDSLRLEKQSLEEERGRLTAELEDREAEIADLNDLLKSVSAELVEAREIADAARLSEQAHARNLELLKSAIEDAMAESRTGRVSASPEAHAAARAMAERLISDTVRSVMAGLTPQNYATSKKRLESVFALCERHGISVPPERKDQLVEELREEYKAVVRRAAEREEQARIKAQIREEARLEAERQRKLRELEAQERAIQKAIDQALARAHDEHSREIQDLRGVPPFSVPRGLRVFASDFPYFAVVGAVGM